MPLLPDNLDQHPLPPPAVETPGSATQLTQDPLPRDEIETALCNGDHHLAPHHAQHCELRSASAALQPSLPWASLAGAVVQPVRRPASSLMKKLAVMCGSAVHCMAFARVNPRLVVYRFRTPDGRGPGGARRRLKQPQLKPTPTTTRGTSNSLRMDPRSRNEPVNARAGMPMVDNTLYRIPLFVYPV